ncbi:hypothetical protein F4820DRAFT_463239 [Hypoxylon rubiginosum]|uniref:Uncharacterized protein n=1 Tax=Hypoxylon rubiginosum TaxID=110542 RepID=A0ACB9ZHE1_9PEZI|nr:hypothetical protein F4820DRAFT_463239 [Hypoxylon rubiginosum]
MCQGIVTHHMHHDVRTPIIIDTDTEDPPIYSSTLGTRYHRCEIESQTPRQQFMGKEWPLCLYHSCCIPVGEVEWCEYFRKHFFNPSGKYANKKPNECRDFVVEYRHERLDYLGDPLAYPDVIYPTTWRPEIKEQHIDWARLFRREHAEFQYWRKQEDWDQQIYIAAEDLYTLAQDANNSFLVYCDLISSREPEDPLVVAAEDNMIRAETLLADQKDIVSQLIKWAASSLCRPPSSTSSESSDHKSPRPPNPGRAARLSSSLDISDLGISDHKSLRPRNPGRATREGSSPDDSNLGSSDHKSPRPQNPSRAARQSSSLDISDLGSSDYKRSKPPNPGRTARQNSSLDISDFGSSDHKSPRPPNPARAARGGSSPDNSNLGSSDHKSTGPQSSHTDSGYDSYETTSCESSGPYSSRHISSGYDSSGSNRFSPESSSHKDSSPESSHTAQESYSEGSPYESSSDNSSDQESSSSGPEDFGSDYIPFESDSEDGSSFEDMTY